MAFITFSDSKGYQAQPRDYSTDGYLTVPLWLFFLWRDPVPIADVDGSDPEGSLRPCTHGQMGPTQNMQSHPFDT